MMRVREKGEEWKEEERKREKKKRERERRERLGKKLTRVAWCILKRALGARFFAERKSKTPPRDIGAPGGSIYSFNRF